MEQNHRFHRFRPVTVRAAARLAAMSTAGRFSPEELEYYFQALALSEPCARPGAGRALGRLARRRSAFGRTGVLCPQRKRGARRELEELPECLRGVLGRQSAGTRIP